MVGANSMSAVTAVFCSCTSYLPSVVTAVCFKSAVPVDANYHLRCCFAAVNFHSAMVGVLAAVPSKHGYIGSVMAPVILQL